MLRRLRDYIDELQLQKEALMDDIISSLASAGERDAVLQSVYKAGFYAGLNTIKGDLEKVLRGDEDNGSGGRKADYSG